MPIETNFKFGQSVAPPAAAPRTVPRDPRGLLTEFVGDLPLAAPGQTILRGVGRDRALT